MAEQGGENVETIADELIERPVPQPTDPHTPEYWQAKRADAAAAVAHVIGRPHHELTREELDLTNRVLWNQFCSLVGDVEKLYMEAKAPKKRTPRVPKEALPTTGSATVMEGEPYEV